MLFLLPAKRDQDEGGLKHLLNPKTEIEIGSAPAPGAVFRALAENNERNKKVPVRPGILVSQTAGREARPATPEAGVLPSSGF
jgi:hypothetical protein